jgi:hypothetical protein
MNNNKYMKKIKSKGLSNRKKKRIAQDFIEGITNTPFSNMILNIAIINDYERYLKNKNEQNGEKKKNRT